MTQRMSNENQQPVINSWLRGIFGRSRVRSARQQLFRRCARDEETSLYSAPRPQENLRTFFSAWIVFFKHYKVQIVEVLPLRR